MTAPAVERKWCAWCGAIVVNIAGAALVDGPDGRRQWACDSRCLAELVAATVDRELSR
jgi:hypothetical protein